MIKLNKKIISQQIKIDKYRKEIIITIEKNVDN